jgi:CheY-like chemotaxis protein
MTKILIVDDDPSFVESTSALLETKGYSVISAPNGQQGCAKARSEAPDVMLLDVMMSHDTEGFETVRKLREDPQTKHLPVILITGIRKAKTLPFRFEPDEDWLPVKAVLEKPVKPDELLHSVQAALAK